jgi:hypothetical protein
LGPIEDENRGASKGNNNPSGGFIMAFSGNPFSSITPRR